MAVSHGRTNVTGKVFCDIVWASLGKIKKKRRPVVGFTGKTLLQDSAPTHTSSIATQFSPFLHP